MIAAIYCRVSTDRQEREETIQTQITEIERYCEGAGIVIGERYYDDGISGRLPFANRSEGARLLADAEAGRLSLVITYKTNRMGRDSIDILGTLKHLRTLGVRVLFARERFEDSPVGRFAQGMISLVSELEWENIREATMAGLRRAAAEGKWVSGPVPYGYLRDNAYLVIDETPIQGTDHTPASIVRLIYHTIADEQLSTWRMAQRINSMGIPTVRVSPGRKRAPLWRDSRIRRLVHTPTYRGEHIYHAEAGAVTRQVPAIVDPDTWERAIAQLKQNMRKTPANCRYQYLLRSLIRCGTCGMAYCGHTQNNSSGIYQYYACWGRDSRASNTLKGRCSNPIIPAPIIEAAVWADVEQCLRHPEIAIDRMRAAMRQDSLDVSALPADRRRLEAMLTAKVGERQEMLTLFRRGIIRREDLELQMQQIANEEDELLAQLQAIDGRLQSVTQSGERVNTAGEILANLRDALCEELSFEAKREIVRELVRKITIQPDGTADVAYWFEVA